VLMHGSFCGLSAAVVERTRVGLLLELQGSCGGCYVWVVGLVWGHVYFRNKHIQFLFFLTLMAMSRELDSNPLKVLRIKAT
jgi:hypothetical protein